MYASGLGPPGADVVLEVVGSEPAVGLAVRAARPGGRVVLVGIPEQDRTAFPASVARRKGLTLAVVRRMKEVYPRAVDLVERGVVDVASLVTARLPLERVEDAFAAAAARTGIKVVVEVSGQSAQPVLRALTDAASLRAACALGAAGRVARRG